MLNQEEDHLSGLKMVSTRSITYHEAEMINLSTEAYQTRQRNVHVSHVAKKVIGNVTVQTENIETMVNKK